MKQDVEHEILLDVIFSNCTKENINNTYKNLINHTKRKYKNRLKELTNNN